MQLKLIHNQKGQAIFEMILFLPILLFLYTIFYTSGNAINGSINQQKATRGYFYSLVKGNSYLLSSKELYRYKDLGMKRIGFNGIGWADHLDKKNAVAPCFRFSSLLKNNTTEECEGSERDAEQSSRFIRVFTYYGVCGPSYTLDPSQTPPFSPFVIDPGLQGANGFDSCIISTKN